MSGILLPGQENQPEESGSTSGGGIELPKGFSGRTKKRGSAESEAPAEAEGAAPDAAPPPDAPAQAPQPQPGQPGGQPDFLFPPSGAQVQCPNCGTPYTAAVFTIVDLGANPELRSPLLSGQLNMAVCPNCNAGGPLSAPLMVHDPDHQFLGVFIPSDGRMDDAQSQRIIGELTQTLMRKLPSEQRKGYLFQARQFFDWQNFMEALWEFEGVTPEMLRRQREQSALLQRLAGLVNDPSALKLAIDREATLIDRDFFALLDRIIVMAGGQQQAAPLLTLRRHLLENTEAGAQVKAREDRVRAVLQEITPSTSREELLDKILGLWAEEEGSEMVATLAMSAAPLLDYQFLTLVTERLESSDDETEQEHLSDLRELILEIQEQQQQSQASVAQQAQAILQEVLQAEDPKARLRELSELIDENFLSLLAGNIQAAEKNKATAAARRLRQIYEAAMEVLQEGMPEDLRFLNELLSAPDASAARTLLKENRHLVNQEFLEAVSSLESEMRRGGRTEMADRLKSLRGQIALMV